MRRIFWPMLALLGLVAARLSGRMRGRLAGRPSSAPADSPGRLTIAGSLAQTSVEAGPDEDSGLITERRAVWRPRWYWWALAGLATLFLVHHLQPERLEGKWLVVTPIALVVALFFARRLWEANPAVVFCLAIALRVFSGAWSQIGFHSIPLDRVAIVFAFLQIFLRAPGTVDMPRLKVRGIHLLMAASVLYVVVAAVAAGTLTGAAGLQTVFDEFGIVPFLAFLVAPSVFAGRRERDLLLATLVGVGLYLGITAFFEAFGPHALVFPHYINNIDAGDPSQRVNGPFGSSVAEGCATFACAVAGTIATVQWRGRKAGVAMASILVCFFACFATLERGVWIAAVAAIVFTALTSREGRRLLPVGVAIGAILVGGLLVGSSSLAQKASNRATDERSVWDRQTMNEVGLRMVAAKPLFGFGPERYKTDNLEYFRQPEDRPMTGYVAKEVVGEAAQIQPIHNLYLAQAVELGLVGFALWIATLLWGVGGAALSSGPADLRIWKRGLFALAVFFFIVTAVNPKQPPFEAIVLWTWAGVALGAAPSPVTSRFLAAHQRASTPVLAGALAPGGL